MRDKEFLDLAEAYNQIYQKNVIESFDEVLEYLLYEGYSEIESHAIVNYFVEQGMPPQEVIGRGIANLLGLDRPHPTQVFGRAFKAAFMNKPQTVQAPTPKNPPKVSPVGNPPSGQRPSTTTPKPNPYRPGATIRATGPGMERYGELQRFANQGKSVIKPVSRASSVLSGIRTASPLGVASAVSNLSGDTPQSGPAARTMQSMRASGSGQYGRYAPAQSHIKPIGPKNPEEGMSRAQSFDKAYARAKQKGGIGSSFNWRDKSYKVY